MYQDWLQTNYIVCTMICSVQVLYSLVGFYILLGGVHGGVVDGEHARRRLRFYGAKDELAGAVRLLAEKKVEEGELVHVVRDLHLSALFKITIPLNNLNRNKFIIKANILFSSPRGRV